MVGRAMADDFPEWEHFAHRGDVGVRGYGMTRAAAFENAARALMAVITDPALVAPDQTVEIECVSADDELLLAEWLNTLIFEMGTRNMLFSEFRVRLEGGTLRAEALGETIDVERHEPAVEVKGATYTALKVSRERNGRWLAQCVVDV